MDSKIESVFAREGSAHPPVVKICGLQDVSHARAAALAGADMLGLMLAPSRRRTTPRAIRTIREALQSEGQEPLLVGVFVNATADEINEAVADAGLDVAQLSGDERPEVIDQITVPVIKAVRPEPGAPETELLRTSDLWFDRARPVRAFLLDAHVPGSYGGAGVLGNWTAAALVARRYPVLLAGGLNAANVSQAITSVRPLGVDVSSSVEVEGVKDPALIEAFVEAARANTYESS